MPPPASVPPPTPAPAVTPSDSTGATPPASTSEPQRSEPEAPAVTADRAAPPREESERNTLAPEDVAATTVPLVTEARVCEQLRTGGAVWRCDPVTADSDVASYYTRIRSARRLTVQHVWLRDGREVHRASLRVDANAREGYRTYSRQRLTPGSWQVRVMDAGGNVLEEDAFEVR
ncbi:MAG: DUF2914 domain-containing protein [Acidobacteria bacterium]|nr:DUF2914 domain-containing protein [Acidobacteriota bacterium]